MARLDKTAADYVAIAISPALIMLMVGSLMYFLVAVFYGGRYEDRIYWILTCYTVAIVLISRISMEDSQERAMLFAGALAMAVGLAVMQLADAIVLPWCLLGLVWWAANKLTWDCTLIDEDEDASGRGLLQIVGLERRERRKKKAETKQVDKPDEPEGVTDRTGDTRDKASEKQPPKKKPHAPGVWIVYFSLAALPLFGLGQLLVPMADLERRRWVFQLLCVYVGSGLGLLLTTSFLGLRRYLRQRDIQMPEDMAKMWIALGTALIVILLTLAALLPRPAAEYALSQFPLRLTTPERESSRLALGNDGADQNSPDSASRVEGDRDEDEAGPPKAEQGQDQASDSTQRDSTGKQSSKQGDSPRGQQKPSASSELSQGEPKDGQTGEEHDKGQRSQTKEGKTTESARGEDKSRQQPEPAKDQADDNRAATDQPQRQPQSAEDAARRKSDTAKNADPSRQPSLATPPPRQPNRLPVHLPQLQLAPGGLLKLVLYTVVLCAVGYVLWKTRERVFAAIRQFLQEWREFWTRLFGGKRRTREETVEVRAEPARSRPFSDYADPFASRARRMTPEQVVRHSFEALEAWAREHDCPRQPDQTPREFARQLGSRFDSLSPGTATLADLFARVAYASAHLGETEIAPLALLWQRLRSPMA
jgi:hypothetical protein